MSILNFFKKRKILIFPIAIAITFASLFLITSVAFAACTGAGSCTISQPNDGTCMESFETGISTWECVDNKETSTFNPATGMTKAQEDKTSGGFWDFIGDIAFKVIFKLVDAVLYFVFQAVGLLLYVAGALLDFVLTSPELQKFATAPIVIIGWGITKNLANMFFALILLVISFATILRIESYGVKQVLPRLIIAALLINFSLVIGGVFIDFSQVLTKYFVDGAMAGNNGQSISVTIADNMRVTQGILTTAQSSGTPNLSESLDGIATSTIGLFAGIVVILIAAFTIFAAAILFVVRFIALLFLLILAPLAWFFYIVPMTRRYWDLWWSTFFKYVFFAPAYAFFLYLSLTVIKSGVLKEAGVTGNAAGPDFGRYSIPVLINFIVIIGFLLGSLIVAQKMGVWGGGAMLGWVKSAGKGFGRATSRWAARGAPMPLVAPVLKGLDRVTFRKLGLGKAAASYEARKAAAAAKIKQMPYVGAAVGAAAAIRETLPTLFVPAVWKRAMASSRARAESKSYAKASGRLEGLLSGSAQQAKLRELQAQNAEVAKKENDFKMLYRDEDARVSAYQEATDPVEKEALLRILAATTAINTLFTKPEMAQHLSTDPKTGEKQFDGFTVKKYIEKTFGEEAGRVAADISAIGVENGNFSLAGMAKWDDKKQKPRISTDDEQKQAASVKMKDMEPQDWNRRTHPDSFFKWKVQTVLDKEGKAILGKDGKEVKMLMRTKELSDVGKQLVGNITENHVKQLDRIQQRNLEEIYKATDNIQDYAKSLPVENQAVIKNWLDGVATRYRGKGGGQTIVPPSQQEFKEARQQKPPGAFG